MIHDQGAVATAGGEVEVDVGPGARIFDGMDDPVRLQVIGSFAYTSHGGAWFRIEERAS